MEDPRPTKLSPLDIAEEVAAVRETDDTFRLYRREWVIVHTVTGEGPAAEPFVAEAFEHIKKNVTGRVRANDITCEANTNNAGTFWVHVKICKPNMKGEFKYRHLAERFATKQGYDEYEIVARNSKHDHEIRSYGVKLLP